MEIELRPVLLVREHSRDKPTFSWAQFQTIGQTPAPQIPSRRFFSYQRRAHPFGNATAVWVKQRFAHDEISGLLAEQRSKQRPYRYPQPTMLYQKRQVVL
jgi:hypothetical protein